MKDLLFIFLYPLSKIYWLIISIRNLLFEIGIFKITKVSVPVISVGNITLGGNGKTPTVESIISILLKKKIKVAVISRGYKRKTSGLKIVSDGNTILCSREEAGDEAIQVSNKFPSVIVIVDEKRVRAANYAINNFGVKVIILDDGFQHRWIYRDLNLVIFNESTLKEKRDLIPAGNYREPMKSLSRSDAAVIYSNQNNFLNLDQYWEDILPTKKIHCRLQIDKIENTADKHSLKINNLKRQNVLIFSGIAKPERFNSLLREEGILPDLHYFFPDHHWYTKKDNELIMSKIKNYNIKTVLTTEKDYSRMSTDFCNQLSESVTFGIVSVTTVFENELEWEKLILSTFDKY